MLIYIILGMVLLGLFLVMYYLVDSNDKLRSQVNSLEREKSELERKLALMMKEP